MSRIRTLVGHSAALTARSAMAVAKIFGVSEMVWSGISRLGIRGGGVQAASGVLVTAESAMLVAAYKRGVELLAGHVAKTNFCVKRGSEHDKQHPAYKLLRRWARHHQVSAFEFRRTMMAQVLTRGNAYAYIVRRNMEPVELLILDAGQIQPYLIQGELFYSVNGRPKMLSSSDVIHIKGLGFNGFEGLDPIRYYAKEVLGLAIATQNYAAKYYENGGTPSAYLKSEVPLTDDQFNRLKGEAGPLKRSLENPHELPILEQTDIKSVGLSAEQTQLLSARKDIILDIANLLGLPPHKLGLAISSSYGSLEEENDAFREDALEPWLCQFESEFAKLLTEDEQDQETHDIEAERDDIKRLKLVDAADYLSKLTGSQPLATVNEARAKIGLPPVKGGDDLSKPLNMGNQGGDPAAQPNASPPEQPADETEDDDVEESDDTETESDDTEERSAVDAIALAGIRRNALADVYGRMARRLTNALKSVKSVDQLPEFRSKLAENHLPVIQSAFAPIVPLVGGDDPNALAAELVSTFEGNFAEIESRGFQWLLDDFETQAATLSETAFAAIDKRCGSGAEGSPGFQAGNTCGGSGASRSKGVSAADIGEIPKPKRMRADREFVEAADVEIFKLANKGKTAEQIADDLFESGEAWDML
jgi:HK97 family phage portal protein